MKKFHGQGFSGLKRKLFLKSKEQAEKLQMNALSDNDQLKFSPAARTVCAVQWNVVMKKEKPQQRALSGGFFTTEPLGSPQVQRHSIQWNQVCLKI